MKEVFDTLLISGYAFHVFQVAIFLNAETKVLKNYEIYFISNFTNTGI